MQDMLLKLEHKALSALTNINPADSSYHDFANIVRQVDAATAAVNRAYVAINKASANIDDIKGHQ